MKVVYHSPCTDGFAALWVAIKRYGWHRVEPVPAQYGDDPPDVTDEDVLVVDFSYPRDVLLEMAEQARSLRVLDHHETARKQLEDLPFALFDESRSGAGLAWDELMGGERPWLIDYVEDRDLWRWALPQSEEVNALIATVPMELAQFDWLEKLSGPRVVEYGTVALRARHRFVEATKRNFLWAQMDGGGPTTVPCVNGSPSVFSEVLGQLVTEHQAPFAVGWFQRADGRYQYSLRSREDGWNVAQLAEAFGGGGHPGAAGFITERPVHRVVVRAPPW